MRFTIFYAKGCKVEFFVLQTNLPQPGVKIKTLRGSRGPFNDLRAMITSRAHMEP